MVKCNQCDYEWEPKIKGTTPTVCTRCKRYDWQEPKKALGNAKKVKRVKRGDK